jgi:hypothetical protein
MTSMNIPKIPRLVRHQLGLTVVLSAFVASSLSAATLAHWRFEEGTAGSPVPAGAGGSPDFSNTVLDSSGNGNHMRTWATTSAPTYVSNVPFSTVPQTGQANNLALNFSPNQDVYSDGKPINSHLFTAWTVEASFNATVTEGWQVIVGKDGQGLLPGAAPGGGLHAAPPFMLKTVGGGGDIGKLELGMVDGSREFRSILTQNPLVTGEWYSVAATATADELSLWLKSPGDVVYVLQGTMAINGAFTSPADYNAPGDYGRIWTVGRGMWNNNIADFFNGMIDEVRISDVALDPSQFLAIPEPSTYALLAGLGALALVVLRRRKG